MDAAPEIQRFLDYLRTERGYSEHTVQAYARDLTLFQNYFRRKRRARRPTDLSVQDLLNLLSHLQKKGYAASSRARLVSALRSFYRYLVEEEGAQANPAELLETPRKGERLPEVLTYAEVLQLLETPDVGTPLGLRDRAMLEFLYATGARVSEMLGLRLADLDLRRGLVRLRGKGRKVRLVPLGDAAREWLQRYLKEARPQLARRPARDRVFVNARGGPLSRTGFWKILRQAALKAGLGKRVYPHILRHTFATHMLSNGCNLRVLQELLGHASVSTTEVYTHLSIQHLKEVFQRYHPRA